MNLSARQRAFFLITLSLHPKTAMEYIKLLPKDESQKMLTLYENLKTHQEGSIQSVALSELRKMAIPKNQSYLTEVHNDWIIELLLRESPQMIATILRYLPAGQVKAILETLPKPVLQSLPKVASTFAIPLPLVDLLKQKFEAKFILHKTLSKDDKLDYDHLCLLRAHQIKQVFMEIGYREIALGLKSLPKPARSVVLDRLSSEDRNNVEYYYQNGSEFSLQRIKRAQTHLARQDSSVGEPHIFVKELGYLIYSKSVLPVNMDDIQVIKRKMSKQEAQILQNMIDDHLSLNSEGSVVAFREDVLIAMKAVLGGKKPKLGGSA